MSDDGHSDTTTCDGCGKEAPWQETTTWSVKFDNCYCPSCTVDLLRPPISSIPNYFVSDVTYQGDPFHE